MKKSIFSMGATIVLASVIFVSCEKKNSTITQVDNTDRKTVSASMSASYEYTSRYFSDLMKGQKVWDVLEDGNGTQYCESAKGSCTKANKPIVKLSTTTADAIIGEIGIIDGLGNPNDYFETEHWGYLFEELEGNDEMLERINSNEIHLIKVPTADRNSIAGYVLTTATSARDINKENVLMAWEY